MDNPTKDDLEGDDRRAFDFTKELLRQTRLAWRPPPPLDDAAFRWASELRLENFGRQVAAVGFKMERRQIVQDTTPLDIAYTGERVPDLAFLKTFEVGGRVFLFTVDIQTVFDLNERDAAQTPEVQAHALGGLLAFSLSEQVVQTWAGVLRPVVRVSSARPGAGPSGAGPLPTRDDRTLPLDL